MAGMFNINPILSVNNGEVKNIKKIVSMNSAINWLVGFVRQNKPLERVAIIDFEAEENAGILEERLIKNANISKNLIYHETLGPIVASHAGPGTFGIVTVREK